MLSESSTFKLMVNLVKEYYAKNKLYITENFIYAIGSEVALNAHCDTVNEHRKHKETPAIYQDAGQMTFLNANPCAVLGADDRAGLFAIIYTLTETDLRPTLIITRGEEVGGVGAKELITTFDKSPNNLAYIVGLDYHGENFCTFYDCRNPLFKHAIVNRIGATPQPGIMSDISIICPAWNVAGVNISVGYWNEHTSNEILNYGYLFNKVCAEHIPALMYAAKSFKYIL